jgi:hypothetical protein
MLFGGNAEVERAARKAYSATRILSTNSEQLALGPKTFKETTIELAGRSTFRMYTDF